MEREQSFILVDSIGGLYERIQFMLIETPSPESSKGILLRVQKNEEIIKNYNFFPWVDALKPAVTSSQSEDFLLLGL